MNKKILLLLIFSFFISKINAQDARFNGFGNASVALHDLWSVYNNQAGLAFIKKNEVGMLYVNQFNIKEVGRQAGAFALPTKSGNFAFSYKRFGYNLYSENNFGLAYARHLGKYISVGIQFDYLYYKQSGYYKNHGAVFGEIGVIGKPIDKLYIGFHLYNPTQTSLNNYNNQKIRTAVRFGLGYYFTDQVVLAVETEKNLNNTAQLKCGVEYEPIESLFLRTGFSSGPNQFSLGIGYKVNNITADISFATHESLPMSMHITLKYAF